MEVDFSSRIKAFFEAKTNSSESIVDSGDLSSKVESILVTKASEHNERFEDKVTVDQLKIAHKHGLVEVDMFLDMKKEGAIEASYEISDQHLHLNC